MTIVIDATLVVSGTLVETNPVDASFFNLFEASTAGPQIAPESSVPYVDPITGVSLRFVDGVVIGSALNGLSGTASAFAGTLLASASDINLSDETTLIVFTFEQPDGSQLVVRATISDGDGPTLQEFVDGYTLEELLGSADLLNGEPYTFVPDTDGGTAGADNLNGDANDNLIEGKAGNDTIFGSDGNDTLRGGNGSDEVGGGAGRDALFGGGGDDMLRGGNGNDEVVGGAGRDTLFGGRGQDTLDGGAGADTLAGRLGADLLIGRNGNDNLLGQNGSDTMSGGAGRDRLVGGRGADDMDGGGGNDRLIGGKGNDTITGGAGRDTFIFLNNDRIDGQIDTITDFESGADRVRLSGVVFEDLTITDGANGAEVAIANYTIVLEGMAAADLGVSDFIFV